MQRKDIKLGVEYAATGALAYGREPHVTPSKVRFLSLNPTDIIIETHRKNAAGKWAHEKSEMASFPGPGVLSGSFWSASREAEANNLTEFRVVAKQYPGDLVSEKQQHGQWVLAYTKPAEVHRTWAMHQAEQQDRQNRVLTQNIQLAPERITTAIEMAIRNARLIHGDSTEQTRLALIAEIERQLGADLQI